MKAWVLHAKNDIRLDEVPDPKQKENEMLVKVMAASICSTDYSRVYGTSAYHYPIILGHEFSVVAQNGERFAVFPLLPCFKCESCQTHRYETCISYGYLGSRQDGAFAECISVPKWNLIRLPDSMTFEQAALIEPSAVALHAVKRLDFAATNSVAVVGNGTIGRIIAKWLSILGVEKVHIIGRNNTTSLKCYDACFEAVGTAEALSRCIELVKPNGLLVVVGNPNESFCIEQMLYWQILRKQISVIGSWNSDYPDDWNETINNADKLGLNDFIDRIIKFNELGAVFENMRGKSMANGRIIIA